jgi:flagellin
MSSINTNVAAMAAIRSLSSISTDMAKTQGRIETGLRIGQANNDPAVFSIAQNMRADLRGLTAVKDSLAFGKATVTVARDAATKISDELAKLKGTVTQGQQRGIPNAEINSQINEALANIDAYANTADFNGVNLLTGGTNLNVIRDITGNTTTVAAQDLTTAGLTLAGLQVNTGSTRLSFDQDLEIADGDGISVTRGGATLVFEFNDAGDTALDTEVSDTVRVRQVDIDTASESPLAMLGKLVTAMQNEGINASFNNNGEIIIAGAATVALGADGTAAAAGMTSATITGGSTAIAAVEAAIDTVGTALSAFGAKFQQIEGLQDFTAKLTDSIKEGLGALVDADLAEESARLTSLQTRQQLATQSLSIANQQSQSLLSLFR